MSLVTTPAIVLHAFDYMETSRVVRLLTREVGVQSVIAKGARRTRSRTGSAIDLFAGGEAQIYTKTGRELNTLGAFEVTEVRDALGTNLDRFAAACAVAELVLRIATDDTSSELYDVVARALDDIASAPVNDLASVALGGAWCMVALRPIRRR